MDRFFVGPDIETGVCDDCLTTKKDKTHKLVFRLLKDDNCYLCINCKTKFLSLLEPEDNNLYFERDYNA